MSRTWRIYTDGACPDNQNADKSLLRASCGIVIEMDKPIDSTLPTPLIGMAPMRTDDSWQMSFICPGTATNYRAEFTAICVALEQVLSGNTPVKEHDVAHIVTDSQPAVDTLTKWINGWARNGWKTKKGAPLKSVDIVKRIYAAKNKLGMRFQISRIKHKSHSSRPFGPASSLAVRDWVGNDRADKLANMALAASAFPKTTPLKPLTKKRPIQDVSMANDIDKVRARVTELEEKLRVAKRALWKMEEAGGGLVVTKVVAKGSIKQKTS